MSSLATQVSHTKMEHDGGAESTFWTHLTCVVTDPVNEEKGRSELEEEMNEEEEGRTEAELERPVVAVKLLLQLALLSG